MVEICIHMKDAWLDDRGMFECDSCESNIYDCDCYDCRVHCKRCNKTYEISCEELCELMEENEEEEC